MIRFFDILASFLGLIVLSPVFLVIAIWIKLDDWKGPVFYKQMRVGRGGVDFGLYKFRSMFVGSDQKGLITIGGHDPRITRSGYFIRKYKLDELPQLINVLKGDMSLVGPRPEVRKYVDMYTEEQRRVLDVRPGITDYASIEYLDENALLALSDDPDRTYIEEIMPAKIRLNMKYINHKSLKEYLYIILKTFMGISLDKLTNWYFTKGSLPYWGVLAMDILVSVASCLLVYMFSSGLDYTTTNFWHVLIAILVYVPPFCLMGKVFHTYEIQFRYATLVDLRKVGTAMFFGVVIVFCIHRFTGIEHYTWPLSNSYIFLAGAMATLAMMFLRIIIKSIYNSNRTGVNVPFAVIYGTQENVEILAQAIMNQREKSYRIFGFLTDDAIYHNHYIMGKRLLQKDDKLVDFLLKNDVETIICGPIMSKRIIVDKQFLTQLFNAGIKVLTMPEVSQVVRNVRGDWSNIELRKVNVNVEELLPREEIHVDMEAIGSLLRDKTVMITGAAGSIGSEMVHQIVVFKPKMLVLIDQAESPLYSIMMKLKEQWPELPFVALVSSITKKRQMEDLFSLHRPDYVFHAAAYKHVPMMEMSPANAVQNNCIGTRIIADLSVKYGVKKFVMISTDKAVNPTSVMGCSKRICEIYCQSLNSYQNTTQFVTTRFGNVLGSNGSVVPIFREQIQKGGPVTVTHPDIERYFMLIPEACKLVLQAGTMGNGGEIYSFDMGQPVRIADLARKMIEMSGMTGIKIVYTGLRDGEKLYEEVISAEENTLPTSHPKIRVAQVREYDYIHVQQLEDELENLSYEYNEMATVQKMKEIVPEYISNHSRFEVLDSQTENPVRE